MDKLDLLTPARRGGDTAKLDGALDGTLLARLDRFLPSDIQERIAAAPPPVKALKDATQHLESLYHTIGSYLPEHLRDPDTAYQGGRLWPGSFLFADVSGFTNLFEKLSVLGDEGAELLTDKMNEYFFTMLDVLSRSNGILMKFAGDALLAFFPRPEPKSRNPLARLLGGDDAPEVAAAEDVGWAVRAALRMQREMGAFEHFETRVGPGSLTMSVGISSGKLFAAHVGTDAQRDYMILGDLTGQAMDTEAVGASGEVIIDRAAYERVAGQFRTVEAAPGMYRVIDDLGDDLGDFESSQPTRRRGSRYTTIDSNLIEDLKTITGQVETIAAFLPKDLLSLLVESGEKRAIGSLNRPKTAVIFCHVTGFAELLAAWGEDELPRVAGMLDRYYNAMQSAIARYGGSLARTDPYQAGDKLLATFGAPIKHYDDSERAVLAALEMHAALARLNAELRAACPAGLLETAPDPEAFVKHRIGVTQGDVLGTEVGVGQTGRGTRREYTVMGDDVNLAARLMSKAAMGTTLVNDKIWRDVNYRFEGQALEPVKVKGKKDAIAIYGVTGAKATLVPPLDIRAPLIGRRAPMNTIRAALDGFPVDITAANHEAPACGQVIAVSGSIGVGKSRLLHEAIEHLKTLPVAWVEVACVAHTSIYHPWTHICRRLLGLDAVEAAAQPAHLEAGLEALGLEDHLPALAAVLVLPGAPPCDAEGLDVAGALIDLLKAKAPLVLVIDDLHHADPASRAVMRRLYETAGSAPLLALVAVQPDLFDGQIEELAHTVIALNDLGDAEALEMAKALLQADTIDPELEKLITRQTQNRPLFIEVLVEHLRATDGLRVTPKRRQARLVKTAGADTLPSTTRALVLSRIDRLPVAPREALLAASVLGEKFKIQELISIHEDDDLSDVQALCREGVMVQNRLVKDQYHFVDHLTQVVAYNSLPNSRRRELHLRAGNYWAEFDNPSLMQLAERAYHHARCDDPFKAVDALTLARDRARLHGANEQAIAFGKQLLEHARGVPELTHTYQTAAETLGDLYAGQGYYGEATGAYEPAVRAMYEAYLSALCRQALVTLASDPIVAAISLTRALTIADTAAPVRPWLQAGLAWLLWRRGAYEAAAEYTAYDAGLTVASMGSAAAMLDYVYGLVERGLGNEEKAQGHLQEALNAWQARGYEEGIFLARHALDGDAEVIGDDHKFLRVLLALYFELNN
ncbi:MAG: AAA family ATPase [Anaerolineae bacterium]|nr:AAA family ATPase [Anaerolineae bacterium]